MSYDPETAYDQGRNAATAAFIKLTDLGVDEFGSIEYVDIEAYDSSNANCRKAVSAFVKGWEVGLDELGDESVLYSNSADGIRALVVEKCWDVDGCPDNVWMANWNEDDTVWGDPYVANTYWRNHQRLHQYEGNTWECYGGVCRTVDLDCNLGEAAGGYVHNPAYDPYPSDPVASHPSC